MKESTRTVAVIVALVLILLTIIAAGVLFVFINRSNQQFNQELRNDVQALFQSVESLEDKIDDLEVDAMDDTDSEVNDFAPGTTLKEKDTTGMNLFESDLGFSFMYPEDWFAYNEPSGARVVSQDVASPLEMTESGVYIDIQVSDLEEGVTLDMFTQKEVLSSGSLFELEEVVLDGVVEGYQRIESSESIEGIESSYGIATFAVFDEKGYVIRGSAFDKATFDRYEDEYQDIVSSFKF